MRNARSDGTSMIDSPVPAPSCRRCAILMFCPSLLTLPSQRFTRIIYISPLSTPCLYAPAYSTVPKFVAGGVPLGSSLLYRKMRSSESNEIVVYDLFSRTRDITATDAGRFAFFLRSLTAMFYQVRRVQDRSEKPT